MLTCIYTQKESLCVNESRARKSLRREANAIRGREGFLQGPVFKGERRTVSRACQPQIQAALKDLWSRNLHHTTVDLAEPSEFITLSATHTHKMQIATTPTECPNMSRKHLTARLCGIAEIPIIL